MWQHFKSKIWISCTKQQQTRTNIFLSVKKINGKKPFASVSVLALVYSWKNERSKKNLKIKIEEFCYPEVHDTSSAI